MARHNQTVAANQNGNQGVQKEWTVMVYMVAGNDSELDAVAVQDIREMERGVGLNRNDDVHVVVQINRAWPDSAQQYAIKKRSTDSTQGNFHRGQSLLVGPQPKRDTNMADVKTLTKFVTTSAKRYPAKHYFLVLWGHAYGLGFGRDHDDALTLAELKSALAAFEKEHGKRLELLGTNACAMGYAEAIFQLRESAEFLIASQIAVPLAGFPYESILGRIRTGTTAEELGRLVVDSYVSHFNALSGGARVTMTLLRLGKATLLQPLVKKLAKTIDSNLTPEKAAHVRDAFLATATGDVRPLLDLKELCTILSETVAAGPGSGSSELDEVRKKVDEITADENGKGHNLVVRHRSHPALKASLAGVGIFAPFVTDERDRRRLELAGNGAFAVKNENGGRDAYKALELFDASAAGATWPSLVYDTLAAEIPSDLRPSIQSIPVTAGGDRADIAQIIMAIDASFNMLDRAIANSKKRIVGQLESTNGKSRVRKHVQQTNGSPSKNFGQPWLRLASQSITRPMDATAAPIAYLQNQINALASLPGGKGSQQRQSRVSPVSADVVTDAVEQLAILEKAIERIERATKTGLTNAKFGIGPSETSQVTGFEDPKEDHGAPSNGGTFEDPKEDHGVRSSGVGGTAFGGDLRGDLALARVQELFSQVGQSLRDLESALSDLEVTASATLTDSSRLQGLRPEDYAEAATQQLARAFRILEEFSLRARRTLRRVLTHPIYGMGTGSGVGIGVDEREELARSGGLDGKTLRLL